MREYNLKTEPLQFITIKELSVKSEINTHGTAMISGYIADEHAKEYLNMLSQDVWEKIVQVGNDGEEQILFWGVITGFSMETVNEQKKMTLELTTGTFYMDINKHFRTYQDSNTTYGMIFEQITATYRDSGIIKNKPLTDTTDELILQYKETDWGFLKRLASKFQSFLVPSLTTGGVKYFLDLPKRNRYELPEMDKCMIRKSIGAVCLEYCIESRENYQIGDQIKINGAQFYVYRVESKYERGEILHTCYSKAKEGLNTMQVFQDNLAGCSFLADVTQIKDDKVQISVLEDENKEQNINLWYPYSTVYSTPDGTGWYCMPEVGDTVRLHIPSSCEEEAYVISSVHLDTNSSDRKNPDHKIIKNKYQKEVRFTPDSIVLTNNQGTRIELTDSSGVTIVSQHDVVIKAKDNLVLSSENGSLTAAGTTSVNLKQKTTSIDIAQGISFTGGELKVQ